MAAAPAVGHAGAAPAVGTPVAGAAAVEEPVSLAVGEQPVPFARRLAERVAERRSQIVLGLDPDPMRLWPRAIELAGGRGDTGAPAEVRAALAVSIHCALAIDAAGPFCVAVKPQLACFERLGAPGWAALADVVRRARSAGLLVIADAKRGDIGVSASAYAQAFFGQTATPYGSVDGLGVDALTVSPLLGSDTLEPFVAAARAHGCGLFVLVRTSNPGAGELQDRTLEGGGTVSGQLADLVTRLGAPAAGADGLSDVGAVVGATAPEQLAELRSALPHAILLLPGVGAQGGRVEDLAPAFAPGRAAALVTASRAIVDAHVQEGGEPAGAAARAAERLRDSTWALSEHSTTVAAADPGAPKRSD